MKDLHSHLIFGIDDGSKTLEESLNLIKKMAQENITDIMCTPHYIENTDYVCNNHNKQILISKLKRKLREEKINVNLYSGNEVFMTKDFIKLIKSKEISTLNNSKYILFEFPMNNLYKNSKEILLDLLNKGYVPILAHPERYKAFQKHPDMIEDYIRMGVLLQGNFTSLFGKYGSTSKKILKYYIKRGWISFLGSDTHHDFKFKYNKLIKILKKITKNEEYIDKLLYQNFDKVINNEDIGIIR